MYLYKCKATEILRNVLPVITFPLGAGGEAYACWIAVSRRYVDGMVMYLALLQVAVNVIGGGFAYPRFISKAIKSVSGGGRSKKSGDGKRSTKSGGGKK